MTDAVDAVPPDFPVYTCALCPKMSEEMPWMAGVTGDRRGNGGSNLPGSSL